MTAAQQRAKAILNRLKGMDSPKVAELGVFVGDLSKELLAQRPDLTLVMVDNWGDNPSADYLATRDFHANAPKDKQVAWERACREAVAEFGNRVKIVRKATIDAADDFPDHHFDLVFIDADHSYSGCKADIYAWKDKVAYGGWLSGHDYKNDSGPWEFGVTKAVDEWSEEIGRPIERGENFTWFTKM